MPILARAGKALIFVGVVDIGVMLYCILNQISYSSSFNVFAVIAGVFLMRGSLRAASLVHWFSVFFLSTFAALAVAWPFLQPLDLTLTQARQNPASTLLSMTFMAFLCTLLYWLMKSLGHESVLKARRAEGRKQRSMWIPAVAGVGLVVALSVFVSFLLGGDSAKKAVQMAQQELGTGYKFHVSSLNISSGNQGTSVRSVVTAWNSTEVRNVRVSWQEH
jgi:hypothetical protein